MSGDNLQPTEPVAIASYTKVRWPKWRIVKRQHRVDRVSFAFAVQHRSLWFFWDEVGGYNTLAEAHAKLQDSIKAEELRRFKEVVYEHGDS